MRDWMESDMGFYNNILMKTDQGVHKKSLILLWGNPSDLTRFHF